MELTRWIMFFYRPLIDSQGNGHHSVYVILTSIPQKDVNVTNWQRDIIWQLFHHIHYNLYNTTRVTRIITLCCTGILYKNNLNDYWNKKWKCYPQPFKIEHIQSLIMQILCTKNISVITKHCSNKKATCRKASIHENSSVATYYYTSYATRSKQKLTQNVLENYHSSVVGAQSASSKTLYICCCSNFYHTKQIFFTSLLLVLLLARLMGQYCFPYLYFTRIKYLVAK